MDRQLAEPRARLGGRRHDHPRMAQRREIGGFPVPADGREHPVEQPRLGGAEQIVIAGLVDQYEQPRCDVARRRDQPRCPAAFGQIRRGDAPGDESIERRGQGLALRNGRAPLRQRGPRAPASCAAPRRSAYRRRLPPTNRAHSRTHFPPKSHVLHRDSRLTRRSMRFTTARDMAWCSRDDPNPRPPEGDE